MDLEHSPALVSGAFTKWDGYATFWTQAVSWLSS